MKQIYLEDPYIRSLKTPISDIRIIKKKLALSFEDNIFYPGGGGQPADLGRIDLGAENVIPIIRVLKQEGRVYACLSGNAEIQKGTPVLATIDWERRYRMMRYHTAAHTLMSAIRRKLSGYIPNGIEINDDGTSCSVRFSATWTPDQAFVQEILELTNSVIHEGHLVEWQEHDNIFVVQSEYSSIYRGPENLAGHVRVVVIKGWDANPCGGTHVRSLAEVGTLSLNTFGSDHVCFSLQKL